MGYFPALYKGTQEVVVSFDYDVIAAVWKTMTSRRSRLNENPFYVNFQTGVCYPILGTTKHDHEDSKPTVFLTKEEFAELMAADQYPFAWTPGLINNDMTVDEFRQTLKAAAREHGVDLPQ